MYMYKLKNLKFQQIYPWVLVIGGIIGLLASSILTIEKLHLAANLNYVPSCSISPVVACSPAGAKNLKKWFWWCFQAGTLFGALFITWLQYSSIYSIQKLCIYCMIVWLVTVPIFWTTLSYNLREKNFKINGSLGKFLAENPGKLIALHYILVVAVILFHFSDYFYSLI